MECISKGKVRKPYEFGVKVSVATTLRSNFVVASHAVPGNPYDGHTLPKTLLRCFETTGVVVKAAFVDRGYRGCRSTDHMTLTIAGQRRGMTKALSATRSALMAGAGQNLRMILNKLRLLLVWLLGWTLVPRRSQLVIADACI